jgi:hypothetical protein
MASYLVTGAGRGLGLEFVKQTSQCPAIDMSDAFATTRSALPRSCKGSLTAPKASLVHLQVVLTDNVSVLDVIDIVGKDLAKQSMCSSKTQALR